MTSSEASCTPAMAARSRNSRSLLSENLRIEVADLGKHRAMAEARGQQRNIVADILERQPGHVPTDHPPHRHFATVRQRAEDPGSPGPDPARRAARQRPPPSARARPGKGDRRCAGSKMKSPVAASTPSAAAAVAPALRPFKTLMAGCRCRKSSMNVSSPSWTTMCSRSACSSRSMLPTASSKYPGESIASVMIEIRIRPRLCSERTPRLLGSHRPVSHHQIAPFLKLSDRQVPTAPAARLQRFSHDPQGELGGNDRRRHRHRRLCLWLSD